MLERIRLNGGHTELSVGGFKYLPDETGAFEVPAELAAELIRVHGGEFDAGVERLEDNVTQVEAQLAAAKNLVEMKTKELQESKERVRAYKEKRAKAAEPAKSTPTLNLNQNQGNRK